MVIKRCVVYIALVDLKNACLLGAWHVRDYG